MPADDQTRADLRRAVLALDPIDDRAARSAREFVDAMDRLDSPFSEDADPTHVTGSAVVVGPRGVVLHRHKRLGIWLQPGGHVDPGETPAQAALRESHEETGLPVSFYGGLPVLFHVDVHPGPRGHTHLDTRYLVMAPDVDPSPPMGESPDCRWFGWDEAVAVADEGLAGALHALRPDPARVSFRVATASDAVPIAFVHWWSRVVSLPSVPVVHSLPDIADWVRDVLVPAGDLLVVQLGEVPVGMLAVRAGHLDHLYLAPPWWGSGIGSACIAEAKRRSPDGLSLWTFQDNAGARRFYARHGFAEVELTDGSTNEERSPDVRMVWRP
ncbi:MAG: GNAT family N-acetyltransferase [Ilumatobacteraceae bacterium]